MAQSYTHYLKIQEPKCLPCCFVQWMIRCKRFASVFLKISFSIWMLARHSLVCWRIKIKPVAQQLYLFSKTNIRKPQQENVFKHSRTRTKEVWRLLAYLNQEYFSSVFLKKSVDFICSVSLMSANPHENLYRIELRCAPIYNMLSHFNHYSEMSIDAFESSKVH